MKEFCNQINVYLSSDVQKIESGEVIPKSGKNFISIHTDDFFIETNSSNSSASILNSVSKKLYADKLPAVTAKTFASRRSTVIECKTDQGNSIILGTVEFPAKMLISPSLNVDIISIDWLTPSQISM